MNLLLRDEQEDDGCNAHDCVACCGVVWKKRATATPIRGGSRRVWDMISPKKNK